MFASSITQGVATGDPAHVRARFQQVYDETVGKIRTKTEKAAFNAGASAMLNHLVEELTRTATLFGTRAVMFGGEEDEIKEVKKSMTSKFKQIKKDYKPSNARQNSAGPTPPQSFPSTPIRSFAPSTSRALSVAPGPAMVGHGMHQQTSMPQQSPAVFNRTYVSPANGAIPPVPDLVDAVIEIDRQKANQQSPNHSPNQGLNLQHAGWQNLGQQQVNWYTGQQNAGQNNIHSSPFSTAASTSGNLNQGTFPPAAGRSMIVASPAVSALGPNESLPSHSDIPRNDPGTPRKRSTKKGGCAAANKANRGSSPDIVYDFAQSKFFIVIQFQGQAVTHELNGSKAQNEKLQQFLQYLTKHGYGRPMSGVIHINKSHGDNFNLVRGQ